MTTVRTLPLVVDAYTDVPAGLLPSVVTYLEMTHPVQRPARADVAPHLRRLRGGDLSEFRALYREIGEELLWFSRRRVDDAALAALLDEPALWCYAVTTDGRPIGLMELDARAGGGEVELSFFGFVPTAVGSGFGRWAMNEAVRIAFAELGACRLWLHTCHYDHPGALDFYRRSGFAPYKRAIELTADPRLDGTLPETAAAQIPLLR